jgi:hypothetical protein
LNYNNLNTYALNDYFKFYCTTFANPKDNNIRVDIIDKYVDAFLPQIYLETWGYEYIQNMDYWIKETYKEYKMLNSKKPLYPIINIEKGEIGYKDINKFFEMFGPESSLWRIPSKKMHLKIWETIKLINWNIRFFKAIE